MLLHMIYVGYGEDEVLVFVSEDEKRTLDAEASLLAQGIKGVYVDYTYTGSHMKFTASISPGTLEPFNMAPLGIHRNRWRTNGRINGP